MLSVCGMSEGNDERRKCPAPERQCRRTYSCGARAQSCQLAALTSVPHHSAMWQTTLLPHATPPSEPQQYMIIWRGRSLEKLTETWDISVDLKSRSGGSEITVEGNTRKEKKHCRINGRPLNVWQGSGRESPADCQIASRCACDSVMMLMTKRIINRNRGGD